VNGKKKKKKKKEGTKTAKGGGGGGRGGGRGEKKGGRRKKKKKKKKKKDGSIAVIAGFEIEIFVLCKRKRNPSTCSRRFSPRPSKSSARTRCTTRIPRAGRSMQVDHKAPESPRPSSGISIAL